MAEGVGRWATRTSIRGERIKSPSLYRLAGQFDQSPNDHGSVGEIIVTYLSALPLLQLKSLSEECQMPSLADIANNLKDRIWFTRIARIYSEKRLLRNELHSQLLLMFYAVYSIALSVTQLKYKPIPDDAAAVLGIILSVILFGLTFHMSSRGFPARAQRFKENYTNLQELFGRLEVAECQADSTELQKVIECVQVEYKTVIANSENHTTMDDRCARFPYGKNGTSRMLSSWDHTCVLAYSIGRYLSLGLLYVSPVVIYIFLLCAMK